MTPRLSRISLWFKATQIISCSFSSLSVTFNVKLPSSSLMRSPIATSSYKPGKVTEKCVAVPRISFIEILMTIPVVILANPPSKLCVRISGPLVSNIIGMMILFSFSISRIAIIFFKCSSYVPCEKFSLATFMPALTSFKSISFFSLAGPMGQTIFVFLINCSIIMLLLKRGSSIY